MTPLRLWIVIWGGALLAFVLITRLNALSDRVEQRIARRRYNERLSRQLRKEIIDAEKKGSLL